MKTLIDSLDSEVKVADIIKLGEMHADYAKQGKFKISTKNFSDVGAALIKRLSNV